MVADNAIIPIKNSNLLPFQLKNNNKIVICSDEKARNQLIKKHLQTIANELNIAITTQDDVLTMMADDKSKNQLTAEIQHTDLIILATYNLKKRPLMASGYSMLPIIMLYQ